MPDCKPETCHNQKNYETNKKATIKRGFSLKLVAGAGFEPTTFGL
jgi:hypothetical protein